MRKKLGIIQSRGLGDIVIALPIALHYHQEENMEIFWPVEQQWVEQLSKYVPWVNWIPLQRDSGAFFYDVPMSLLQQLGCDQTLCLYQALTGHPEFTDVPWFQHVPFDRYKYIAAGRPFTDKLRLNECITRNDWAEEQMFQRMVGVDHPPYVVTHLTSSEQTVRFDPAMIPEGWMTIPITQEGSIFEWLKVIERAEAIIFTDSVMANLVDGLDLEGPERYFIPQHHIQLTPTLLGEWTWLHNPDLKPQATIFRAS